MKNTFDEYKMIVLLNANLELQTAFKALGYAFDFEWFKTLIIQGGMNFKAKMALKKVFNENVLKDENLNSQYSEIEALKVQNHFYYVILETNGERTYHHNGLVSLDEDVDPDEWLDAHTRGFYDNFSEEDGVYWFDGEVICEPFKITKLTWEEHETMKKFMV